MKALKIILIVPVLFFAFSCKKTTVTSAITTDEAADMGASAVATSSFGFVSVTDNVGTNAQTLNSVSSGGQQVNAVGTSRQTCGTTLADSLTISSTANSAVTFSAFYKYVRTLNCNANSQPDNLVNVITFKGNFDGPRLTSTDNGTSNITIGGLTANATNFVVNGTYNRKGSFVSKVGGKAGGSSNVTITAANVLLSKPGRQIVSGSATITISGNAAAGTFNYTGVLSFKGDNQATLTVGSTIYLINLLTGTWVKQ